MFRVLLLCLLISHISGQSLATDKSVLTDAQWTYAYNTLIMCYSSYCCPNQLTDWSCPTNLCGNPQSAGFFDDGQFIVKKVYNDDAAGIQYYIAVQGDIYFLVFRGTDNRINDIEDLLFPIQVPYPINSPTGSKIALGFLGAISDLDLFGKELETKLKDNDCYAESCNLVVTGHSLGGSLATLAGYHLSLTYSNTSVYTFGSPRTGNAEFAKLYNDQVKQSLRFVYSEDTIPHLPWPHFKLGDLEVDVHYQHVNNEVFMPFEFNSTDHFPPQYHYCDTPQDKDCSFGAMVHWENFDSLDGVMWYHRNYFSFDLETFCNVSYNNWTAPTCNLTSVDPSITPSPSPTVSPTTPSPSPSPTIDARLEFPIITQRVTEQWSSFTSVLGRFNNSGPADLVDPVFISSPNAIPIAIVGLKATVVNGILNWRLSPAGSWTRTMPAGSFVDFSYTINSTSSMTFTRIQ
eukprot:gene6189-7169_t